MAMDAELERRTALSPGLMVVLTGDGPKLAPDAREFGPLGVAELQLLLELANGVPADDAVGRTTTMTGGTGTRLADLVTALQANGLLVAGHDTAPHAASPRNSRTEHRPLTADERFLIPTPLVWRVSSAGFEHLDHTGDLVVSLTAAELAAASTLRTPLHARAALAQHQLESGSLALEEAAFESLIARLATSGVVHRIAAAGEGERDATGRTMREWRAAVENIRRVGDEVAHRVEAHELELEAVRSREDRPRINLIGVQPYGPCPPLAIAMVLAYAKAYDGGRLAQRFDFFPRWLMANDRVPEFTATPAIFLFSNYLWSTQNNLEITADVKRVSPGSITVHGGPDTPKYEEDVRFFFATNPHLDIAVRGEGEATMAGILEALMDVELGDGPPDLSCLRDVPGICFRDGDEVVRTPDRERISDVDLIPSPYLTGLLEAYSAASESTAIIETNRGCPYGCTFCDWGSATLSRIRKFDLDRVFGELEWCAQNGVARIWVADANFGIFERDVAIAEKVAELRTKYGYPKVFATNYAKNTVKHLKPIVKVMADAGILTEGLLSLQSMDENTLDTISRSNIKLERYEDLAREFRAARLPLYVDLMLGLPGATSESFRNDLQECIDREVNARIFSTTLLVNSPMNEPEYRTKHKIQVEVLGAMKQKMVVSTATFTRDDYESMSKLREIYIMCENHGILRQLSRYVRHEMGVREIDLYEMLWRASLADRDRWPAMAFVFEAGPSLMVEPVSWRLFIDEVGTYLVDVLGVPADKALESALLVQHGLLPSRGREFPYVLDLDHDFGLWHAAMIGAKDEGHIGDWPEYVPHLRDLPARPFSIDDPNQVCTLNMGYHVEADIYSDWELRSPVARSLPALHLAT